MKYESSVQFLVRNVLLVVDFPVYISFRCVSFP
jgi:hypothetical protein